MVLHPVSGYGFVGATGAPVHDCERVDGAVSRMPSGHLTHPYATKTELFSRHASDPQSTFCCGADYLHSAERISRPNRSIPVSLNIRQTGLRYRARFAVLNKTLRRELALQEKRGGRAARWVIYDCGVVGRAYIRER